MDILVLQKAISTAKTLVTLAIALNIIVVLAGIVGYIQGGKFNVKLD